jgi:hypothetical protein
MAFVSGFRNDIFVSYAHMDNEEDVDGERPVSRLVDILYKWLRQRLGSRSELKIYFDRRDLRSNHDIKQALEEARESAIFVAIVSPGYVDDQSWALKELRSFMQEPQAKDRCFALEVLPPSAALPQELGGRKRHRFWTRGGSESHTPLTLDPRTDRTLFIQQLTEFVEQLKDQLLVLQATPVPAEVEAAPAPLRDAPGPVARPCRGTVLLAQTTDDLEFEREQVAVYLRQSNVSVLPVDDYPQGGEAFQAAFAADLEVADLVVQLLGRSAGRMPADMPQGYQHCQQTAAIAAGKPLLAWRHPRIDVSQVSNDVHRALLSGEAIMVAPFESFKGEIVSRLDAAKAPRKSVSTSMIYVGAERGDLELAEMVRSALEERGLPVMLPVFNGSAEEIKQDLEENLLESDNIVLLHGKASVTWVRSYLRNFTKVVAMRENPPQIVALLRGPPPEKSTLNTSLPYLRIVDCSEGLDLRKVVALFEADA